MSREKKNDAASSLMLKEYLATAGVFVVAPEDENHASEIPDHAHDDVASDESVRQSLMGFKDISDSKQDAHFGGHMAWGQVAHFVRAYAHKDLADIHFRAVLVGDGAIGKTSLMSR